MTLPADYYQRLYAGVLGKLIGVYLGRPFEGWRYQEIVDRLGHVDYYVHDKFDRPLVVADDDVAGTFTFIRALEDYGLADTLTAEQIGQCWLNYIIDKRTILWWGGNGNSTEQTAWLNLKKGIPAPLSGAASTNGKTIAEQIGSQIFIDGWALVAPGQPALAASLAQKAASVSHDGEAVWAAMLWAAMEAQAFVCDDIQQLLEVGLSFIPKECEIAHMIADVRRWQREDGDWHLTREKIDAQYGYDSYPGNCPMVPNHALMIMAMLYAPDNFQQAQCIINTSGRDTDCNAGNVGCLSGIMTGLAGIDAGPDWRGPLADRLLISSADGGFSINNAVRITDYLYDLAHQLAGLPRPSPRKDGAPFHFSLPGSVQGFRSLSPSVRVSNAAYQGRNMLCLDYPALPPDAPACVTTLTFSPPEVADMLSYASYDLMATPLVYPGQQLQATLFAPPDNRQIVTVRLCYRVYDENSELHCHYGDAQPLPPGGGITLTMTLPDCHGQPIAEVGVALAASSAGRVLMDTLRWDGTPHLTLRKPAGKSDFWWRAWVNGADLLSRHYPDRFRISSERDEGLLIHGTREWRDYRIQCDLTLHLGDYGGLAFRFQGMRRYYAARLTADEKLQLIRVRDDTLTVLAEAPLANVVEREIAFDIRLQGTLIEATVDNLRLRVIDDDAGALADGGCGLLVFAGAISSAAMHISPVH